MTELSQDTHDQHRPTTGGDGRDQPTASGGWFQALVRIVSRPQTSFQIINRSSTWLPAMLLMLFGTLVVAELSQPYQEQAMRAELARTLPGGAEQFDLLLAQAEQAQQASPLVRWAGRAIGGVAFVAKVLVQAAFVWLLAVAFQGRARFMQALSLMVHLSVISVVQGLVAFLIARQRGLDAIQTGADAKPVPGLNLLLGGDNAVLQVVWTSINPFTIWFLVLLGLGSAAVLGLPQRRGFLLAGLYWAATTGFTAAMTGVMARLTSA